MKQKLNGSNFEPSQNHMHIPTCDIGSFDDFLSYLRVRPVIRIPTVKLKIPGKAFLKSESRTTVTFKLYGAYPEIAQKVIEGANITCLNMHVILR